MATAQQIIDIIIKAPLVPVKKKKIIRRRRRKKMTFRDTMPTRAREIKQAYIDLLESQITHLRRASWQLHRQ